MNILQILFGSIFVLFLPGFGVSYVFFTKGKIDVIERLALSMALSLSIVPLLAFYANLIGIPITKASVLIEVGLIIIFAGVIILLKSKRQHA